jgi:hypothetical protein
MDRCSPCTDLKIELHLVAHAEICAGVNDRLKLVVATDHVGKHLFTHQ